MAAIRQNRVVPPEDGLRDKMFPHYKMVPSYHQSRLSSNHQESKRIMTVLQDWTEANQRYKPHQGSLTATHQVKVDRVGTQSMLNQDAVPISPHCERRMTPDLIRVSPQQQMSYQGGQISRGSMSFMTARPLSAEVPKHISADDEIYQPSLSDDYNISRKHEMDQLSRSSSQGLNFSNPTYSRVNSPSPSDGGDFYSKENIRSVSQMLLLTSPEAKSTPLQNNFSGHQMRGISGNSTKEPFSFVNKTNIPSSYSTKGFPSITTSSSESHLNESKLISNHNSSNTCVSNQVFSQSSTSPYLNSESASRPNMEQRSPKVAEKSQVNDSLLSSPKFKALRIANSSDSAQSSPQISRKSTGSFKSSFCADGESKNSLDSSTLSIATSWSSGLGIPFPQSNSSTSLSTPSPTQKIQSTSTENFKRQGSSIVEEDNLWNKDDMFPWLVSNVAKQKDNFSKRVKHISQSAGTLNSGGKLNSEIQNNMSSIHSRNRHGYQSGVLGGSSYIHPPQYPSIPRAKPYIDTGSTMARESSTNAGDKIQLRKHTCCNCSCHEELASLWNAQSSGIKDPFPLLLPVYDQNQNIIDASHGSDQQYVGDVQTLHPVNRIRNKNYLDDLHGGKDQKGDAEIFKIKGTHSSERNEDSVSCKRHSPSVSLQQTCLTSGSPLTSLPQSSQDRGYHKNIVISADDSGFHLEGNNKTDFIFPTIACDSTPQSYQGSFGRKNWNAKEEMHLPASFPAQTQSGQSQRRNLWDRSSHWATMTHSEMSISLENSSYLSHETSPSLKSSPRSPPKSPNRIPPPVPQRDLSITISNKSKRSPLSLPPYTSDLSLDDVSPRDGAYSHDLRWWEKIDTDLSSQRREDLKEHQGRNGELFQKSSEESQSGPCFQVGRDEIEPPPRQGEKFNEVQDGDIRWDDQGVQSLNTSWRKAQEEESKNAGVKSNLNQNGDSLRGWGSYDPPEGVTEYENVALIDVDKVTRVSESFRRHTTGGQMNEQDQIHGELFPLQSAKVKTKAMGGNVKSIISKLESRGTKMSHRGPAEYGYRQDHKVPRSSYQYSSGISLTMLPSSHPVSVVPEVYSSGDTPLYPTMQNSDKESSPNKSRHSVGAFKVDSIAGHSVPVASSLESCNGIPGSVDKQGYYSVGVGSMHGKHNSVPTAGGRYRQPDVIPIAAPVSQHEQSSTMYILKDDKDHAMDYERAEQRGSIPQTRAPLRGVKSAMQQWVESSVLQLNLTESSSVQQWLFDIRMNTDCESMCVLQGKSIHTSPVNLEMTANTIKESVLRLKTASKCLSAKFSQLHGKLSERSENTLESCSAICKEIHSMVKECEGFFLEIPSNLFLQQQSLMQETTQFRKLVKELESDVHGELHPQSHLTDQLLELGEQCAVFVKTVQTKLIQALVYSVQDSASELNIMVSVKTVHSLITDYPSIKPILLQEQIVGALFQVCLQTSFAVNSVQLLSLQTIAKFCQDTEGRIETEKIGGIGYLSQIISSPTSSESLKIEAAALISQLTAPEVVSDFRQSRFHQHLEVLLRALLDLMEQSRDPLVFLVASSALANITFMGSIVFEFLVEDNAAQILVEGSKKGKVDSLDIKDQIVTIFANMAEDQACRESIKQCDGIPLLIELLQTHVPGFETDDENQPSNEMIRDAKICEQIQQKSAIALARLSKDKTCAAEINQLEGISIFSRICRTSSYRNKSVPVLIACLAALRRLHHALGPSSFHQDDIDVLVRPKMIESIFSCSSMSEESFV